MFVCAYGGVGPVGDVAIRNAMAAESKASASGGRAAGGGGGGIGDGFTNLAAEDSEDELRSSEWEARLASGDLPEDFLRVTEPKAENRDDFLWNSVARLSQFPISISKPGGNEVTLRISHPIKNS